MMDDKRDCELISYHRDRLLKYFMFGLTLTNEDKNQIKVCKKAISFHWYHLSNLSNKNKGIM